MTTFSVLICTYNRPDTLGLSLDALINRTIEKPDQIVVVNGGDERSDHIIQDHMGKTGIKVELVKTVNKNLAASRNIGLAHCVGEIVAMTDDDAEVFPDWVTQVKKIHAVHPEVGGVGGAIVGSDSRRSLLSRIADVEVFPSPAEAGYVRTVPGVNISYKRAVLQSVGSQDEILFRGEDVDFNWRIKRLGYEIFYTPSIKVVHHHRLTLKGLINQFFMYGRGYYLVRRKWLDMYCVYPHGFRSLKDMLKAVYFLGNICYLPFVSASRMPMWLDKILSVPVFMITQMAWKSGIILQKLETQSKRSA
jgi:GT2 family glycosyltransferase